MSSDGDDRAARARARHAWPVRRHALGWESSDDLRAATTVEARLDMMWQLALDAWASTGNLVDVRLLEKQGTR